MLILGEIHTGLLQHSTALTPADSVTALELVIGERIRRSERPIAWAASAEILTGVDCRLTTLSGARTRAVGTVRSRGTITGGSVVQGSTFAQVERSQIDRRQPWSHYLSRPGVVETIGKVDVDDVIEGFTAAPKPTDPGTPPVLDLAAVSGRVVDTVQATARADRRPPMRTRRTRLRWAAIPDAERPRLRFHVDDEQVRTIQLAMPAGHDPSRLAELCEDLALHDWLLTAMVAIVERSAIGSADRGRVIQRLRPAVDHLLHLWMPAARLTPPVADLWAGLERQPGFSRQWRSLVDRVRDQIAVSTLTLLSAIGDESAVRR
jgi:hypothetical protein